MRRTTLIIVVLLSVVACSEDRSVPASYIEAARSDFSARLQVSTEEITVVEAQAVTWSSGALGCAQSGGVYTEAEVDGHLIVLQYLSAVGNYHQGGDDPPFLCLNPTE